MMEEETDVTTSSIKRHAIETKMQFHAAIVTKKAPVGEGEKGNNFTGNWFLSDLPKNGYCKLIYTFLGWPDTFPCNTNQAREVLTFYWEK